MDAAPVQVNIKLNVIVRLSVLLGVTNEEPNATTLSALLNATLATAFAKNIPS
jgi:hypothetical protein